MRCTHCERCCHETEMELCEADLRRLEKGGLGRDEFSKLGPDGVRRLGNKDGFCFFYDRGAKRCAVYARRPLGCVIYPVNMTEDGKITVDGLCPEGGTVTDGELEDRGRQLRRLIDTIRSEARRARQ